MSQLKSDYDISLSRSTLKVSRPVMTVLNLVSLILPSSACLTAPIVENGTHAVVSIHLDFRILAMMGRNSVAVKRNVFHPLTVYSRGQPQFLKILT